MKAKYIILVAFSSFTIMSFAQKKSTYLLSPVTIEYHSLLSAIEQETETKQLLSLERDSFVNQESRNMQVKQKQISIPDDAFDGIYNEDIIESQKMANDCYIAYLIQTNLFKQSTDRHLLNTLCDDVHIQTLTQKYDKKILKRCGKYHNKELHIYEK